jgi:hypothetical protein
MHETITPEVSQAFFDTVMTLDTDMVHAFMETVYASDRPTVLHARSRNGKGPRPLEALKAMRESCPDVNVLPMIACLTYYGIIDFDRSPAVLPGSVIPLPQGVLPFRRPPGLQKSSHRA